MITLIEREFTVDVPVQAAWQHLARVEQWPSWAKHIKQVEVRPTGELGPGSTGLLYLNNWIKSGWPGSSAAFKVTEFNPYHNWKWVAGLVSLTCHYDHRFVELDTGHTKLTWIVQATGFGARSVGRLFAKIYRRNLDNAVPLLIAEMNTCGAAKRGRVPSESPRLEMKAKPS